jgi:hypothetical protein
MKTTLLLIPALAVSTLVSAQCMMHEVPLTERVQNASTIVEGKVISKKCFWNEQHNYIYTANAVEVYKVFKGNPSTDKFIVVTEGGVLDSKAIIAKPALKLSKGQTGIFFVNAMHGNSFKPYSGAQGFIQYDFSQNKAVDAFNSYDGIATTLYQKIKSLTGKPISIVKQFDVNEHLQNGSRATPLISNFSPTTVSAGTGTLLTINGSNFGASQGSGYVSFRNSDMGGVIYTGVMEPLYYQFWSDTQIRIFVPGDAMVWSVGTGNIQVTNNTSETGTSSSPLTVDFNRYEVIWGGEIIPTILYDDNGSGGYTFSAHTEVAALPTAVAALNRAMSTWNCADQVNWNISGTSTSTDVTTGDGTNVIRFDNGSELGLGTLAYGSSYWSLYSNGIVSYWTLTEADITINDDYNWNYGPGNPTAAQYDFESVMLHELGHLHQFNHVINTLSPMYYGIGNGVTLRYLDAGDMAGGINVCSGSVSAANDLGIPAMNLFFGPGCTTGGPFTTIENSAIQIYPNPASNYLSIRNPHFSLMTIEVFDMLGQKVISLKPIQNFKPQTTLDISMLREGIYVLKLSGGSASEAFRFSVKR